MSIESAEVLQRHKPVLLSIQHLRGVAASLVVVGHAYSFLKQQHVATARHGVISEFGNLGVSVFFIISGFIMYFTCREKWNGSGDVARSFLVRRLHRIVPVYWLLTFASVALLLLAEGGKARAGLSLHDILLSLAFIPYDFTGGKFRPVLGVGWTLDFEIFFYLLFAIGLLFPKRFGLPLVLALIAAVIAVGQWGLTMPNAAAALAQPIVALFGVGILLGHCHHRSAWRLTHLHGNLLLGLLLMAAPVFLWIAPTRGSQFWFNPGLWAYSLALVATGAFTSAPAGGGLSRAERAGLLLGDASYFLYLLHPLIVSLFAALGEWAGLRSAGARIILAFVMVAASLAGGIIGHLVIERRLTRLTAPLFGGRSDATSAPG